MLEHASARTDAEFELVDLADFALPHLDEAVPASLGMYANAHTKAWARKVDSFADVRQQLSFSLMTDFENFSVFTPAGYHAGMLAAQLDRLVPWASALRAVRGATLAQAA